MTNLDPAIEVEKVATSDAELAFGQHRTLKAMGDFLQKYGEPIYLSTMAAWGCRATDLNAGRNPEDAVADDDNKNKKANADRRNNPWAPEFKGDRYAAMANVIKSFGPAAASRMARSCNVTLAGTPLRK